MVFLGAFGILLSKFTARTDILSSVVVTNRVHQEVRDVTGMFVNTLPVMLPAQGETANYLSYVRDLVLNLYKCQELPFFEIAQAVGVSDNDAVNTSFVYQADGAKKLVLGDARLTPGWIDTHTAKFDLTFELTPNENGCALRIEYNSGKYEKELIDRLFEGYLRVIDQLNRERLEDISVLSEEEYQKVIYDFNDTAVKYPGDKCVHQLFEEQAAKTPDKVAIIACDKTLTYSHLNEQANCVAHSLIEMGIGAGDIVAFALPRRSYLVATILGILKTGAAYMPIDPEYPQSRINYMIQESRAKLLVTEENIFTLLNVGHVDNPAIAVNENDLFCALHTSGSTGTPKISLLTHGGIQNWLFANQRFWNNVDTAVSATIVTFDAFTIESILTLAKGCRVVFASERDIYNQTNFEKLFEHSCKNLFFATPTKLKNYMDTSMAKNFLNNISVLILGGEIFDTSLFKSITGICFQGKIYNCYGPTETTICSTNKSVEDDDITIGKPIANTQVYILDQYRQPLPIGVAGELCISGDGVGKGYLNRPELTAEKFVPNPFLPGKSMYCTGDLARWRADGEIEYLGRMDTQVKIRGLRIELGEIESVMSGFNGIGLTAVADKRDEAGRQYLVGYYTADNAIDEKALRQHLAAKLPKYMVPNYFVHLDRMPMTPSGKTDRKNLPLPEFQTVEREYAAPQTPTEENLSAIWGRLLKLERVSRTDDFFELGGDSLMAISLLSKLESGFEVAVSIKDIFEHPVLADLAALIDQSQGHKEQIVATGAQRYALLPQQLAIYAVCSKDPQTLTYNMPTRLTWKEGIDKAKLKACILRLFELHPELKTSIHVDDETVYAAFDTDIDFIFEEYTERDAQDFVRPFDLGKAPLLRVGFTETAMLFDMHHIIADGGSMNIILRDLAELYQGGTPEKSAFSYADYAAYFHTADFTEHKSYFKNMLKCDFEPLALPEKKQTGKAEGVSLFYQIDKAAFEKGRAIAQTHKLTDTMVFLGAFGILLSKFTARADILSSVVVTNRVHQEVLDVTGMFVNTLPVMLPAEGETANYLSYVRNLVLNLYKYQELPFFEIAQAVGLSDKNAVNTSFVYQADGAKKLALGNAHLTPEWIDTHTAKFDLTFELTPNENGCALRIEYNSGKYEKVLMDRLFEGYLRVIDQLGKEALEDISVLSKEEYQKLIFDFNNTAVEYPKDKCVHQLFEEQVAKTPDKVALIFENQQFTYRQLDEMSNSLAHFLSKKGIGKNDVVPIIAKRSWHIIVAMLGILKAGAAYMPVDPTYPKERIEYMLDIAKCKIALTFGYEETLDTEALALDGFDFSVHTSPIESINSSEDLCYVIFTSGSTGNPKGVSSCHRNVVNYCEQNNYNIACQGLIEANCSSIVSVTNIVFDIFVTESLLPLLNGIAIYFANDEQVFSQEKLSRLVETNAVDAMQTTPTKMRSYIMDKQNVAYLKKLKAIVLGGEALPVDLYQELRSYTAARIFNIYGPAETTVWSTNKAVEDDNITIGHPIANTQVYILDQHRQPLPIGVAGELCISGDGVGKGYLNRPELTAEKFVLNPFLPGKTMYCTGDLARWRADGEIEYLGRMDTQVKIRGLRIELGEIESVMSGFDGIGLTAATDKRDEAGRQYLVGYYTADNAIDERELRQHLSTKLPKYMVPNYFVHLDQMPMTPSGKTDRKDLPLPEFRTMEREYAAPQTEQENILCTLLAKLFQMERVGVTDDFFELGGDSLRAIEYTAKAHNAGVSFSLQSVFDHPTVEALCRSLEASEKTNITYDANRLASYTPILEQNTWNTDFVPQKCELGTVLLTGGTGFLGAHIIDSLMKKGVRKVYCLVRNSEKLSHSLQYYFDEQYNEEFGRTIIPIVGDLESENIADDLPQQADYVIHAAASVKHYGSWEYFRRINVDGTKRMITYAQKIGARLIHISTISVSGNSGADQMEIYISKDEKHFYESSLYIGQPLDNVYIRSKFEAEMAVLDAMQKGLQANIIRVGNLTNRRSDFKFQANYKENAFLKRVRAVLDLGCLPDYLMPLYSEFSPVDVTAEAITTIAQYMNDRYSVFHVNSDRNLYFDKMLVYLEHAGRPLEVVSGEQFAKRVRGTIESQYSYIFEALLNDLDEHNQLQYDTNIHIENSFTVQYLRSLGFEWPEIDYSYVEGYLRYFTELGYFRHPDDGMDAK